MCLRVSKILSYSCPSHRAPRRETTVRNPSLASRARASLSPTLTSGTVFSNSNPQSVFVTPSNDGSRWLGKLGVQHSLRSQDAPKRYLVQYRARASTSNASMRGRQAKLFLTRRSGSQAARGNESIYPVGRGEPHTHPPSSRDLASTWPLHYTAGSGNGLW